MSLPARKLEIWQCPHCQGQFKADHSRNNSRPPERGEKWSYCPKRFTPNCMEWVCPHCQNYVTPVERYRMTKNNQCVLIDQEWNAIRLREVSSNTNGNFETAVELLPFVELKKVNEILSTYNYPRSSESAFRLQVWQESCWLSQRDVADINQRKKELFKNPFQYFYYVLVSFSGSAKKEKLIIRKRFEHVYRLILDEAALNQRITNQRQVDKPNMHRLLNLLGDEFERAEVFRHLGMFKECIEALQLIDTQSRFELKLKKEMLKRAKRMDTRVFKVKGNLEEEYDT